MIKINNDIRPISYIKSHTAEMIRQIEEKKNPIIITQNGEAKAVLLDVDTFQGLIDTINILKIISIGENDILKNNVLKHNDVKTKIEDKLKQND
jgi:prevent-host-death family protein